MCAPTPTDNLVSARRILREGALPTTAKRLKIPADVVERLAADGLTQCLGVLGPIDTEHAGWALLMSGIRIARSADELVPSSGRRRSHTAFNVGVLWAGLVSAVAGDRLVAGAGELTPDADWEPGPDAHGAKRLAVELADSLLDPVSSPEARHRFTTDSLTELDDELEGLSHGPAGWMLCAFGVWVGSGVGGVATPLTRRNTLGLGRVTHPRKAIDGCALAGALLAETGVALLGGTEPGVSVG